jgi:diaminopimelate epimerase
MDFTKMHGAGNDFVVVDGRNIERDWSKLAIAVLNRHLGIGADSLIVLMPSQKADFGMRTWDADGSEAETCGNGIRCLARYVLEKGLIKPDVQEMTIETVAAINRIRLERKGREVVKFRVNMGKPRFKPEEIPVDIKAGQGRVVDIKSMIAYTDKVGGMELTLNLVSMGNPHAVCFLKTPVKDFPLDKIGPLVENLSIFPQRVNFEVARVIDKKHIEARVWERGVGETLACGSGTCAVIAAAKQNGYTESKIDVALPGGVLNVEWNGNGEIVLGGPAVTVYQGTWPD